MLFNLFFRCQHNIEISLIQAVGSWGKQADCGEQDNTPAEYVKNTICAQMCAAMSRLGVISFLPYKY